MFLGRVRKRFGDKRVQRLIKAFLKAGVLTEDGSRHRTITGTPPVGILSPLLANIALSVLDEHFTHKWEELGPKWTRAKRHRAGEPIMRLVRHPGRLRDHDPRYPQRRRRAPGRSRSATRSNRSAPIEQQNKSLPHRRRVRLSGLAYPTPSLAKPNQQQEGYLNRTDAPMVVKSMLVVW